MNLEMLYEELRQIRHEIHELREEITRYKGFVHGVLWCLGALTAVLGYLGVS